MFKVGEIMPYSIEWKNGNNSCVTLENLVKLIKEWDNATNK